MNNIFKLNTKNIICPLCKQSVLRDLSIEDRDATDWHECIDADQMLADVQKRAREINEKSGPGSDELLKSISNPRHLERMFKLTKKNKV